MGCCGCERKSKKNIIRAEEQVQTERETCQRDKDMKRSSVEERERVKVNEKGKKMILTKTEEREKKKDGVRFCSAPITESKYIFRLDFFVRACFLFRQ